MEKSKIYTKTGDQGETSLVSGSRVPKSDLRIETYGELDELNSRIGLLASFLAETDQDLVKFLQTIQCSIFDLGSNMACESDFRTRFQLPQIKQEIIAELESKMDEMDSQLWPLKNFILPGGSIAASQAHLVRTSARRVERKFVQFRDLSGEELPTLSVEFLNRLSDYFFVLARYLNHKAGIAEPKWKGKN